MSPTGIRWAAAVTLGQPRSCVPDGRALTQPSSIGARSAPPARFVQKTTAARSQRRTVERVVDRLLRPVKSRALAPVSAVLARALARFGAGPVTLLGLAVGLAAAFAAAFGAFALALALWLVNRLLDGLDGEVARALGRASDHGGYLDLLTDLLVYAALPLGAAAGATGLLGSEPLVTSAWTWPLAALLLASYYLNLGSYTLLAALLEKRGQGAAARGDPTSIVMPAGLVEGAETLLLVALMLAFPSLLPTWFALTALLVFATAGQRALWASRTLRSGA